MSDADVQEVLCPNPSCGKKYRLKGKVPATFTCTKCGQAMDLSAFAPAEPAPAPAAARGPVRGAGRATREGRAAGPARGASTGRRGRDAEPEDEGRGRYQAPPKNNNALIFGSLGALVAVILVMVLVMGKKDPPAPSPSEAPAAGGSPAQVPGGTYAPQPPPAAPALPAAGTPSSAPSAPVPSAPAGPARTAAAPGAPEAAPAPESRPSGGGGLTRLQSWPAPAELQVSAEEKEKIERAVQMAIHGAGRDMREAQDALVALDRKAIWRLVSEFKAIQDSGGFEDRQGLIKASIVDRVLRKIDGYMERKCGVREQIKAESSPDWALNVAKRWNGWLERGLWKTKLSPWDPRVDEADEPADKGSGR
ncbi:MAG: BRcat domain-containing protein [Planctomycetia bacterium]